VADVRFIEWGLPIWGFTATPNISTFTWLGGSSGHMVAWVWWQKEDADIDTISLYFSSVTSPPTFRVGIQDLTASGVPDDSYNVSNTFVPTSGINTISISSTGLSVGTLYALVLKYESGTLGSSNTATVTYSISNIFGAGPPYNVTNTASWSKQSNLYPAFYGLRSSSQRYGYPCEGNIATNSISTTGHRIAMRFKLPAGFADKFKVAGLRMMGTPFPGAVTFKLGLWSSSSTLASKSTIDTDFTATVSGHERDRVYLFDDDPLPQLEDGTVYYIGIERESAGTLTVRSFEFTENANLDAVPGGKEFYLATHNATSWTDDDSRRIPWGLVLREITA
jgi:hypothetical protein